MQGISEKAVGVLSSRKVFILALALAFLLRIGWAVKAGDAQRFWDSDSYMSIAESLCAGDGFVWGGQLAGRPPLYPLLVAAADREVCGRAHLLLYTVQSVLGVAAIAIFALGARRLMGPAVAGLTALVLAVYPFHVYYTATVLSETLFLFLVACMFFFLTRVFSDGAAAWAVLAGTAAGGGVSHTAVGAPRHRRDGAHRPF